MKLAQIALTALISAVIAFGVGKYTAAPSVQAEAEAKKETAFERVIRTNTLRCGYLVTPPQLTRDPNTKQMGGISYDIVTEAAKRLNISVEWTEEVSFGTMAEGLRTDRYDAFCFTAYRWSPWARVVTYSTPLYYSTTDVYVRADDTRFDGKMAALNDPKVTFSTIDASGGAVIRQQDFPLSRNFSMPSDTNLSMVFEAVATGKADATISNPLVVMPYLLANPNKLRRVRGVSAVRAYGHAFAFKKDEQALVALFDTVFEEMLTDGTINKILDKYEAIPHSFVRVKNPIPLQQTETQ